MVPTSIYLARDLGRGMLINKPLDALEIATGHRFEVQEEVQHLRCHLSPFFLGRTRARGCNSIERSMDGLKAEDNDSQ